MADLRVKPKNMLAEKLRMPNSGIVVQVLPLTNMDCLKIVSMLSNCTGEVKILPCLKNLCKLKYQQQEPEIEILG